MKVKSALLLEYANEHSTLIVVDEKDEIHHLTSADGVMRALLEDVELPNFKWRRVSGGRVYSADGERYGAPAVAALSRYRKKKGAA